MHHTPPDLLLELRRRLALRGLQAEVHDAPADVGPIGARAFLRAEPAPAGAGRLYVTPFVVRGPLRFVVLAHADPERRAALLSIPLEPGESLHDAPVADRLEKLAIHELGHLAGRPHCDGPACVMRHVARARELDALSADPCDACSPVELSLE